VLRAVPNMTILEVGDATEVESVIEVAHTIDGPVYIRQLRGEVSRIFPKEEPMVLNSARKLSSGTDVALMTSGIMTEEALRALPLITQRGVSVDHLHISTLKPFTDPAVLESMSRVSKGVITMENHSIVGGLGSAVAEVMAENGVGAKLSRIGIPDTYAHGASQKYLMAELGLDARALVTRVEQAVGESLNITDEELTEARIVDVHSSAKAEAL